MSAMASSIEGNSKPAGKYVGFVREEADAALKQALENPQIAAAWLEDDYGSTMAGRPEWMGFRLHTVAIPEGRILVSRDRWNEINQDLRDCFGAAQTAFHRCACGRLAESGIICPTNREGGTCAAGS